MSIYADLSDPELKEKIIELREKVEKMEAGEVVSAAGRAGRRMEFARGNGSGLRKLLDAAVKERDRRAGVNNSAIGVQFYG